MSSYIACVSFNPFSILVLHEYRLESLIMGSVGPGASRIQAIAQPGAGRLEPRSSADRPRRERLNQSDKRDRENEALRERLSLLSEASLR